MNTANMFVYRHQNTVQNRDKRLPNDYWISEKFRIIINNSNHTLGRWYEVNSSVYCC